MRLRRGMMTCEEGPLRRWLALVDGWIQGRVVVHFQLAIDFEALLSSEDAGPECVKTGGEVGALGFKQGKALAIAVRVALGGIGPFYLFPRVIDFQRQDGEAVEHKARRFGVEFGVRPGQRVRDERGEELVIALFAEIVAALVGAVDGAFGFGDLAIAGFGGACLVFDVPEFEVRAMKIEHGMEEFAGEGEVLHRIAMP